MSESSQTIWCSLIFNTTLPKVPRCLWHIMIFPEPTAEQAAQHTKRVFTRLKPQIRKLAEQSGTSVEEYIRAILELDSVVKKRRSRPKKK